MPATQLRQRNNPLLPFNAGGCGTRRLLGGSQRGSEAGIIPNWLADIAIGSINVAIVTGDPSDTHLDHLRRFWRKVRQSTPAARVERSSERRSVAPLSQPNEQAITNSLPG